VVGEIFGKNEKVKSDVKYAVRPMRVKGIAVFCVVVYNMK
jgi:hypothetical protein